MKKTIDLSDKALDIYKKWGHKKSEKVSDAIVEKHSRDTGVSLEARVEKLEKAVEKLEKAVEKLEGEGK
ncbi:MAG: hypothetical protein WC315_06140 [Candidatus Omnitrophota bacterium]